MAVPQLKDYLFLVFASHRPLLVKFCYFASRRQYFTVTLKASTQLDHPFGMQQPQQPSRDTGEMLGDKPHKPLTPCPVRTNVQEPYSESVLTDVRKLHPSSSAAARIGTSLSESHVSTILAEDRSFTYPSQRRPSDGSQEHLQSIETNRPGCSQ